MLREDDRHTSTMQKRLNRATKQSISSCNKGYIGRRKRLFYDAKQALWRNVKREHIARIRPNNHIRQNIRYLQYYFIICDMRVVGHPSANNGLSRS